MTMTTTPSTAAAGEISDFVAGKPGIYEGVPAADYHALKAVSSSVLKKITTHSPEHALDLMTNGMETSDEMDIGSAAHCLMFTPSEFKDQFVVAEQCAATTGKGDRCKYAGSIRDWSGKWFCGTHKGQAVPTTDAYTILSPDNMEYARGIVASVNANPHARAVLDNATDFELSVIVRDDETGLLLKARLDIYCRAIGVMPDLKTCRSSNPSKFKYQARDMAYDVQLCFYRKVALAAGLEVATTPVIAAENTRPFTTTVFDPSEAFMLTGEKRMNDALAKFAECNSTGVWPGYSDGIQLLDVA